MEIYVGMFVLSILAAALVTTTVVMVFLETLESYAWHPFIAVPMSIAFAAIWVLILGSFVLLLSHIL